MNHFFSFVYETYNKCRNNHNSGLSITKAPMVHSSCYTPHWQQWWSLPRHVACGLLPCGGCRQLLSLPSITRSANTTDPAHDSLSVRSSSSVAPELRMLANYSRVSGPVVHSCGGQLPSDDRCRGPRPGHDCVKQEAGELGPSWI